MCFYLNDLDFCDAFSFEILFSFIISGFVWSRGQQTFFSGCQILNISSFGGHTVSVETFTSVVITMDNI